MLSRLREQFPRSGRIAETERIARRMKRLRIEGDGLRDLPWSPGQQLRVRLAPSIFMRDSLRTYSVWRYDAMNGRIDLCVLLHGDAPGARWAESARVGDPVTFWGPRGRFVLDPEAPYHLFAGEETGAVAIQAMIDALPAAARVLCRLEADTPEDELPFERPTSTCAGFTAAAVPRGRTAGWWTPSGGSSCPATPAPPTSPAKR